MSYVGGKARGAEHILAVLNHPAFDGYDYLEPMVGYGHILHRVRNKRSYAASDANPLVVSLLRGVQRGEALPPITRARYAQLKAAKDDASFERAIAAFQWSFNGKEFGGYVQHYTRPDGRVDDIPASRARHYATLRASPAFAHATLTQCDYRAHTHPTQTLVYCDPPYQHTTGYATAPFDHAAFWQTVREWSEDNAVFVSEYAAPPDFVCVAERAKPSCLAGGHRQSPRTERLFTHAEGVAHATLPVLSGFTKVECAACPPR